MVQMARRIKVPRKNTMCNLRRNLNEDITFWRFTQFQFFRQWEQLKEYAHQKGVKLIGDMPFYVNHDSADVWSRRELFDLNPDGSIKLFSGIPSGDRDIRWGNPCYDWDRMKAKNYDWLAERIRIGAGMYDIMRIDHAVAFVHYYGIKDDGARGVWYPGPDSDRASATGIIDCVARERNMDIIVENLGNNNQRTHDLYDQLNWLGMRIFNIPSAICITGRAIFTCRRCIRRMSRHTPERTIMKHWPAFWRTKVMTIWST